MARACRPVLFWHDRKRVGQPAFFRILVSPHTLPIARQANKILGSRLDTVSGFRLSSIQLFANSGSLPMRLNFGQGYRVSIIT
jgi:hypothetical protein